MFHLTLLVPLMISGATVAVWREFQQKKNYRKKILKLEFDELHGTLSTLDTPIQIQNLKKPFDDMSELNHYQGVAWYSLAFSTAGVWFYPAITLLALPLVGYNSYHFIKVLQHSKPEDRTSALTLFETLGVGISLLTGHIMICSMVLASSFSIRKLLLQGYHVVEMKPRNIFNMEQTHVCVLREDIEVEIYLSELQIGDVFVLHKGDIILAEGQVIKGEALVNQYSLQKEMKIIHKEIGDKVFSFTQIQEGNLYILKQ